MSATHAAPVHAAMDNDLMEDAEEQFRSRAGEDLQVDAYELKDILNATFAQGKLRDLMLTFVVLNLS